jgi:hypothetical protein
MSTGPAFNSLGQILARGGEIAIARAILRGESEASIITQYRLRFAPVEDDTLGFLFSHANEMIRGGGEWLATAEGSPPSVGILPTNPFLFGDDWFGKRVLAIAHAESGIYGQEFDIWLDLPDIISLEEFNNAIDQFSTRFAESDPKRWQELGMDQVEQVIIHWLIAERRY